jgi:Motility quorum-sensing regulator, toxin of MqsA
MVNKHKETLTPNYSLDDIRDAAKQGKLRYAGLKVDRDIRNLGYTGDDVAKCIGLLTSRHFKKCLHYENAIYDVYHCKYQKQDEAAIDQIYMKLRLLTNGEVQVEVASFHL